MEGAKARHEASGSKYVGAASSDGLMASTSAEVSKPPINGTLVSQQPMGSTLFLLLISLY